ncbi:MAG: carbohydrate ABC transporter permease [Trueperaceae bacterium]|nr:MAG: carbohydrate ABC transporter permease [Trueperaceae bacterium]
MRRANAALLNVGLYVGVAVLLVYLLFPFYWAIVSSLKTPSQLFMTPVQYLPPTPRWSNYVEVFTSQPFARFLLNSAVVAGVATLFALAIGSFAAYALGRFQFRGRTTVYYATLAVTMFPQISVLGGLFVLIRGLGLYNSLPGLVLTYMIFTLPFTTWLLTSFVRSIPIELEEAATVDGATPTQIMLRILLPLMAPGLVTAGLLAFIQAWNEFLFALTFTLDERSRTVPVAIALFSGASSFELPWHLIMAASVIVTVPLIVLVLVFQRRIVEGLTAGAVKG